LYGWEKHEPQPEASDDSDDYVEEGPIRVYRPDRRHYTGDIHEDSVECRTSIPLAQLNNSPSFRLRFINEEHVTHLQAHTAHNINARKTLRQDTKHLQDAIIKYGYRDTRHSIVVVRARPHPAAPEMSTTPLPHILEPAYVVLDGHHRVAALKGLEARGALPKNAAYPVTVLKQ
jgi:hypothetical protein